jgi:ADP-ribose pyrophosphatase
MNIMLAEDLTLGEAAPEDDEKIELHMTPLSEALRMIEAGKIEDGKTLIGVMLFASAFYKTNGGLAKGRARV